jgi:peptidyl-prolyl cis-trans isomerase B (cyclophilin B)
MKGLSSSFVPCFVGLVAILGLLACEGGTSPKGEAPVTPSIPETPKAPEKPAVDPAIAAIDAHIASLNIDKTNPSWKTGLSQPPTLTFNPAGKYFWNIQTNHGAIKVQFMPEVAPIHVSSTIFLTQVGYYDDLIFHRVIKGFMAQGGCPLGRGTGGPGYNYAGEFDPNVKHDKPGLLSMANAGPGTDGSQFFLTFVPTGHLDDKHTIFGKIVEGLDTTMKELEKRGSGRGQTTEKLLMEKCTITVE